ncbi:MAG: hypothetical protein WKF68_11225 [Daejeonella sp.]
MYRQVVLKIFIAGLMILSDLTYAQTNQKIDPVETYLKGESEFDSNANMVRVPALMGWFRNGFGGKKGMIRILKQNQIIPEDSNPAIEFKKYHWSLYLDNYKS